VELDIVIALVGLAFACEFMDSALGMGYGTVLAPGMIILGFDAVEIVPAILLSQAIAGSSASYFHKVQGNLSLNEEGQEARQMVILVAVGVAVILLAVTFSIALPDPWRELYLAGIVIAMGMAMLVVRRPCADRRRLFAFGLLSVFNKAVTGAGFGPAYTTGQIMCGRKARNAIAITTLLEVPICLITFGAYWFSVGPVDLGIPVVLTVGALFATPLGPHRTSRMTHRSGQVMVGILSLFLGVFILLWMWIRPCIEDVFMNPFFWALFSMLMLMGCTASLLTRRLGMYRAFNVGCVALFALGRFVIPVSCPNQPQFDAGMAQWVIGGVIFVAGIVFLSAARYINPWPVYDERYRLVTTGFFGFVRHPMYLGELLWTLGWSVMWGSVLGVAMVPVWWGALLFHSILEEEHLEKRFGKEYTDYMERVSGRIIPGLPV
jgi:protein-S-isoprenylcysteine O-methyltransferase Ste14